MNTLVWKTGKYRGILTSVRKRQGIDLKSEKCREISYPGELLIANYTFWGYIWQLATVN